MRTVCRAAIAVRAVTAHSSMIQAQEAIHRDSPPRGGTPCAQIANLRLWRVDDSPMKADDRPQTDRARLIDTPAISDKGLMQAATGSRETAEPICEQPGYKLWRHLRKTSSDPRIRLSKSMAEPTERRGVRPSSLWWMDSIRPIWNTELPMARCRR